MKLTESDLRFLVETVADQRQDHEDIIQLIGDKEDFLDQMLNNPKLIKRLFNDEEALIRISPYMLFSILMRQVRRELEKETYVNEVGVGGQRIPVFEAPQVVELLDEQGARDYLVDMLTSFAKTRNTVQYWMERGRLHRKRYSDMDMDALIDLARQVEPEIRPMYYKRIADIALFMSGIFPDSASMLAARPRSTLRTRRTIADYEQEGQTFYTLAAKEYHEPEWVPIFRMLAEKFTLARRALNVLSERYIRSQRVKYFGLPA